MFILKFRNVYFIIRNLFFYILSNKAIGNFKTNDKSPHEEFEDSNNPKIFAIKFICFLIIKLILFFFFLFLKHNKKHNIIKKLLCSVSIKSRSKIEQIYGHYDI